MEEERALTGDQIPEDRHADLKAKIQAKLGEGISIAFFPHVMYELAYLTQCFDEEIKNKKTSHALETGITWALDKDQTPANRQTCADEALKNHFWQQCLFNDKDYANGLQPQDAFDYRYQHLKRIAGRLNQKILDKYGKHCSDKEGFTFEEFKQVYSGLLENFIRLQNSPTREEVEKISSSFSTCPSITKQCSQEHSEIRGSDFFAQGINSRRHVDILDRAIQLECSAKAVNHLVLYKGSNFSLDALMQKENEYRENSPLLPTSVHYPISFFSIYNAQVAAFHHMRKPDLDAHAVCVSLKKQQAGQTPFHIYNVHPLLQLMSRGEFFFPRTKLWNLTGKVFGFFGSFPINYPNPHIPDSVQSDMPYEKLDKKYKKYKNQTYLLAAKERL